MKCAKILTGRIIVEFFQKFKWLRSVIPVHIPHIYQWRNGSKIHHCEVTHFNTNEAKYEDFVSILRSYEQWISEIYVKAGLLNEVPHVDNPEVPEGSAATGQKMLTRGIPLMIL